MIDWPYSAPDGPAAGYHGSVGADRRIRHALRDPFAVAMLAGGTAARWLLYSQVAQVVAAQEIDLSCRRGRQR